MDLMLRPPKLTNVWLTVFGLVLATCSGQLLFNTEEDDLCPTVRECSCRKSVKIQKEWALEVSCKSFKADLLNRLPSQNITQLTLRHGTNGSTYTVLKDLKNRSKNLHQLDVGYSLLDKFELKWLPEAFFEKLVLIDNDLQQIVVSENDPAVYSSEEIPKISLKVVSLISQTLVSIPSLPNSVELLMIVNCSVTGSAVWPTRWPKSLQQFKMSMFDGRHIARSTFQNMQGNLRLFWISYTALPDGIFPHLPTSASLKSIYFQNANISQIEQRTFIKITNLSSLDLASNRLTDFTADLPKSLKLLRLYSNNIKHVHPYQWHNLSLASLDLGKNRLERVPVGLPPTLKTLLLSRNSIRYCNPTVFSQLHVLKSLDLSHNKLSQLPVRISAAIRSYRINDNLLSHVPGPEAYVFCSKCHLFQFGGNNWVCDENFLKMLLWFAREVPTVWFSMLFTGHRGRCAELPKKAFSKFWLREAAEYIDYIKLPPFGGCKYDVQAVLNCTNLNLKSYPKSPPEGPKTIIISGNKDLQDTPDSIFSQLITLKILQLTNNSLKRIPFGLPISLAELNMRGNNITEFSERDVEVFKTLINLKTLLLDENRLKTIDSSQVQPLINLRWIGLESNDLVCDCSLTSFIDWYTELVPILRNTNRAAKYARCRYPEELYDREIRGLAYHYDYILKCVPEQCFSLRKSRTLNCSIHLTEKENYFLLFNPIETGKLPDIPKSTYWRKITLNGLGLANKDIDLRHLEKLAQIDISNNTLTTCPIKSLPLQTEELYLSQNRISFLPKAEEIDSFLPNLRLLDVRKNLIITLVKQQVKLLPLVESILLEENPFSCNCSLRQLVSWIKSNANDNLTQNNEWELLKCEAPKSLHGKRLIEINEQELCKSYFITILGSLVGILIFVICLAIIFTAALRKKRKKREKKEILRGFQELLQQEATFTAVDAETGMPTKSYTYEAFISCATDGADGDFIDILIEELEQNRRYKLCISERDFVPGLGIADNIVESIGSSKRIILILSKNFISSPWCQYEVQVALAELHQRKSKLLLPIMTEDLADNDNLPGSVRSFLSLVPTIQAPTKKSSRADRDKFWNTIANFISQEC